MVSADILGKDMSETKKLCDDIKKLSDEEKINKNEDVKKMIDYYNGMTNAIEERRNKTYENSLTLMAIIITALTIMFMNLNWSIFVIIPISFLGAMFISMLILIIKYYLQNLSNYVFKDSQLLNYTNKWKWFYYGNEHISKININNYEKENGVDIYIKGLNLFINNYIGENINSELLDNLQQLYLLQVHNSYKNRYYLKLVKMQRIGLFVAIGCAIVSTGIALIIHF